MNTCLWKYNWRVRIHDALKEDNFSLPVVYTDGLVSKCKKYRKGRIPFGILCGNSIFVLQKDYLKTSFVQAEEYCLQFGFAGRQGALASYKKLVFLNRNVEKFDAIAKEFGYSGIGGGCYWTSDFLPKTRVVRMNGFPVQDYYAKSSESMFSVLPQIDLNEPMSASFE